MDIKDIINQIAAGDNVAAKESIEDALSAKAFDALQGRKQEIASTLFGGQEQESEEVTDAEETEEVAEDVEHDGEQLDELSNSTLKSYQKKARKSIVSGSDTMKKYNRYVGYSRSLNRTNPGWDKK